MSEAVRVELHGHVAVIEIRRPPANYLDWRVLQEFVDIAERVTEDSCRAIVLCSEGKHFSAGFDLSSADASESREVSSRRIYEQGLRFLNIPVPVIAAVQGAAVGGGLGLACAADFRVGSRSSRFTANFAKLGIHPGFALSVTLPNLVGPQVAAQMLYIGARITGEVAREAGLLDMLTEDGSEREGALSLATEIAQSAPLSVRAIKRTLRGNLIAEAQTVIEHELAEQNRLWHTTDREIGMAATLARETPTFSGT